MVRLTLRIVPPIMLIAAVWVLWREFHHLDFAAVRAAMALQVEVRSPTVFAVLLSIVSFILMGLIEWVENALDGQRCRVQHWSDAAGGTKYRSWPTAIAHTPSGPILHDLQRYASAHAFYDRYGVSLTPGRRLRRCSPPHVVRGRTRQHLSGAGLLLASQADLDRTAFAPAVGRALGGALLLPRR